MSYIRFENIVKSFGSNTVLKDINLEVEKGQLVTLLGPFSSSTAYSRIWMSHRMWHLV